MACAVIELVDELAENGLHQQQKCHAMAARLFGQRQRERRVFRTNIRIQLFVRNYSYTPARAVALTQRLRRGGV